MACYETFKGFKTVRHFINRDPKDGPLTRHEKLSNALNQLNITRAYSYGHEQSANFIIRMLNRYHTQLLQLNNQDFKIVLRIIGYYGVHEINERRVFRKFKNIFRKHRPNSEPIVRYNNIVKHLCKPKVTA